MQPDLTLLPSELVSYPTQHLARRLRCLEPLRVAALEALEEVLRLPEWLQPEAIWVGAFDVERRYQEYRREWLRRALPDGAWKEAPCVAA